MTTDIDRVKIRKALESDLSTIHEVERKSFKDPYPPFFIDLLFKLNSDTFLVAEKANKVIGYIIASKERNSGNIISIAVVPEERGRAIGQALMTKTLGILKKIGVDIVRLEVRRSNVEAQKFYETQGFSHSHDIAGYYGNEDALVYYKAI